MVYVAPDTNVVLRFKAIWDISATDLGLIGEIIWLITPEVIRELNTIKDRERDRSLRRRASEFTKRFEREIENNSSQFVYAERQKPFDYAANALDGSVADERLLADLLSFRDETGAAAEVALLTNDFNLRTRARARGFRIIVPPEALELPEPPTGAEIENQDLRRELDAIRSASPRLDLSLVDGKERSIKFEPTPATSEQFPRPPLSQYKYQKKQQSAPVLAMLGYAATKENPEYDTKYQQYKELVAAISPERWRLQNRVFPLDLSLSNSGSLKADGISVRLILPRITVRDKRPDVPDWPKPPQRYRLVSPMFGGIDAASIARAYDPGAQTRQFAMPIPGGYQRPYITRDITNTATGSRITFDIRDLSQHDSYRFKTLWLEFPLDFAGGDVSLPYEIRADNAPGVSKGVLKLKFRAIKSDSDVESVDAISDEELE